MAIDARGARRAREQRAAASRPAPRRSSGTSTGSSSERSPRSSATACAVAGITRDDVAGSPDYYVVRQAIYAAVGGLAMVGVSLLDPDVFRRYWRQLYAVSLRCSCS